MVISLFPKRRRRRRWHCPLSQEVADPPSFSEIQPEITVREEKSVVSEVSVEVPVASVSRSRRKSAIGVPSPHERSTRRPGGTVNGERHGPRESLCESPAGAGNPRRSRSTVGTPALREISANTLVMDSTESQTVPLESTSVSTHIKSRPSGSHYLEVPQAVRNSLPPRRSSRLMENSGITPSASPSLTAASGLSRTPRRVSFSFVEHANTCPVSGILQRGRDRESLVTVRVSALSDAEENSDYHAFIDGIVFPDVSRNPTRCSRASMRNADPCTSATAIPTPVGSVDSGDMASKELDAQTMVDELHGKSEVPAERAPCKIEVTAPGIPKTELKTVKRPKRVKPKTCEARTSTTGLDAFVRTTRRKKSMCVQIDLYKTTAFKNGDSNISVVGEGAASHPEQIIEPSARSPMDLPRTRADMNTSVTERLNLSRVSCVADHDQVLQPELPPEEPSIAVEEPPPTDLPDGSVNAETGSGSKKDASHLGINVSFKARRKGPESSLRVLGDESETKALPKSSLSQSHARSQVRPSIPVVEVVPPDPARESFRARESSALESRVSAEKLGTSGSSSGAAPRVCRRDCKTTSETTREDPKRSSSYPMDLLDIANPRKESSVGSSASSSVNIAEKSSTNIALRPNITVLSTSVNSRSTFPERENLLETPSLAKRSRTAREPRRRHEPKHRSPEFDLLSITQRIKEKIERKRLIENTIYRRVNLIYEGLWEDFLQTYCPEKWRKVKDAWMEAKAKKRLEEEQRGLGELDDEMEREVQRGTELGAAKYIKEFEEKKAEAERRTRIPGGKSSSNTVRQMSLPLEKNRRQSRRLRDLVQM